jgi:hypothetical protein
VTKQHGYSIFSREREREEKSVILSAATLTNLTEAVYQKRVTAHTSVPLLSVLSAGNNFLVCRGARSGCWRIFAVNRTFAISRAITPSIQREVWRERLLNRHTVFFVLCELWLRKTRHTDSVHCMIRLVGVVWNITRIYCSRPGLTWILCTDSVCTEPWRHIVSVITYKRNIEARSIVAVEKKYYIYCLSVRVCLCL